MTTNHPVRLLLPEGGGPSSGEKSNRMNYHHETLYQQDLTRFKWDNYRWVISMILSVRQVIIFMIVVIQNEYNWNALSSRVTVIIQINLLSNKFYHSNWLFIYVYTVYRINMLFSLQLYELNENEFIFQYWRGCEK